MSALIVPSFDELDKWARKQGISTDDRAALLADERVQKLFREQVSEMLADFDRHEAVQKFTLLPEEMSEVTGLLTPTLKVKRKQVNEMFTNEIEGMYKE